MTGGLTTNSLFGLKDTHHTQELSGLVKQTAKKFLTARVMLSMQLLQTGFSDMGINLRGG